MTRTPFGGSDGFLDVPFIGGGAFIESLLVERGDDFEGRGELGLLAIKP